MGSGSMLLAGLVGLVAILYGTQPDRNSFTAYMKTAYNRRKHSKADMEATWPLTPDTSYDKKPERWKVFDYTMVSIAWTKPDIKYDHYYIGVMGSWLPLPYLPKPGKVSKSKNSNSAYGIGLCLDGRCLCVPGSKGLGKSCYKVVWRKGTMVMLLAAINFAVLVLYQFDSLLGVLGRHCTCSLDHLRRGRVYTLVTAAFSHSDFFSLMKNTMLLFSVISVVEQTKMGDSSILALYIFGSIAFWFGQLIYMSFVERVSTDVQIHTRFQGFQGALSAMLGYVSRAVPSATFTLQFWFIPFPLQLTALQCVGLNCVLDVVLMKQRSYMGGHIQSFIGGQALYYLLG